MTQHQKQNHVVCMEACECENSNANISENEWLFSMLANARIELWIWATALTKNCWSLGLEAIPMRIANEKMKIPCQELWNVGKKDKWPQRETPNRHLRAEEDDEEASESHLMRKHLRKMVRKPLRKHLEAFGAKCDHFPSVFIQKWKK